MSHYVLYIISCIVLYCHMNDISSNIVLLLFSVMSCYHFLCHVVKHVMSCSVISYIIIVMYCHILPCHVLSYVMYYWFGMVLADIACQVML